VSTSYKERLYENYLAGHLVPRKGDASLASLEARSARWEKTMRRFLPPDRAARIADLGCGYGALVWWLQREGYVNACGVDLSAELIEQGRRLGVANLYHGDLAEFLRTRGAESDLLVARDLFEHLPKADLIDVLALCRASLRPGAALVIQVPNGESPLAGRIIYGDYTHETAFTQSSIGQVLRAAGFGSVTCLPVRPVVYGIRSALRAAAWRVIEAAIIVAIIAETGPVRPIVTQNLLVVARNTVPAPGR
jgi:2-polyprenyl-3-methyl-5-hydroxy-6-metoxy-1,4-benzoquinol methylase